MFDATPMSTRPASFASSVVLASMLVLARGTLGCRRSERSAGGSDHEPKAQNAMAKTLPSSVRALFAETPFAHVPGLDLHFGDSREEIERTHPELAKERYEIPRLGVAMRASYSKDDRLSEVFLSLPVGSRADVIAAWGAPTVSFDKDGKHQSYWLDPGAGVRVGLAELVETSPLMAIERYQPHEAFVDGSGQFAFEEVDLLGVPIRDVMKRYGVNLDGSTLKALPVGTDELPPTVRLDWATGSSAKVNRIEITFGDSQSCEPTAALLKKLLGPPKTKSSESDRVFSASKRTITYVPTGESQPWCTFRVDPT
jgi:hypothetical protein